VDWMIGLLNALSDANPHLGYPHSSQIRGKDFREFRELRADCGRTHHRILFRRSGRLFILLHIVVNKRGELPAADKQIALDRWRDFVARMDAKPRGNPRAIGHDAP